MNRFFLCLSVGALASLSCIPPPPAPTERGDECNQLCARYISLGNLQAAEDQCDLGIEFSPQYADLWVNKGVIAFRRGQHDKAKEYLIKALRLNQNQAQAYNNLGMLYLQERSFGKAHDNFQRALKVDPDYLDARYNLALALKALNDIDGAKKEFRTLIHIKPELADAWAQLGQIALDEKANELAIEYLSKATLLDPRFTAAWLVLGSAQLTVGKPCEAKDSFTSCLENEPESPSCHTNIIAAEAQCKLQDKALEDVKARAAGSKTPEDEYALALKARESGLVNDEERAYKRCLKYDARFPLCHFGLFELFKNRTDSKNATAACQNVLRYAKEPEHRVHIEACKRFLGE